MMIIFQILGFILLIPLTALMLLIFNVYTTQKIYLGAITIFGILYSALCGFVLQNFNVIFWVCSILTLLYIIRMRKITTQVHAKKTGYSFVRGAIRIPYFDMDFIFPLSFLKVLKWVPNVISKKISKKIGSEIIFFNLVDLFLSSCIGTQIDVKSDVAEIYFEIH